MDTQSTNSLHGESDAVTHCMRYGLGNVFVVHYGLEHLAFSVSDVLCSGLRGSVSPDIKETIQ